MQVRGTYFLNLHLISLPGDTDADDTDHSGPFQLWYFKTL